MLSVHPSRGRSLFEVFCALTISASCVGAWMQTGASALLPAAAVAALYGIVRAFDAGGTRSARVPNPEALTIAPEDQGDLLEYLDAEEQTSSVPAEPVLAEAIEVAGAVEEAERVEPAATREGQGSRARARRKVGGRRASAPDKAKVAEPSHPEEVESALPVPPVEAILLHIEPLFEPEPFVRMPRRAFGRKAG